MHYFSENKIKITFGDILALKDVQAEVKSGNYSLYKQV